MKAPQHELQVEGLTLSFLCHDHYIQKCCLLGRSIQRNARISLTFNLYIHLYPPYIFILPLYGYCFTTSSNFLWKVFTPNITTLVESVHTKFLVESIHTKYHNPRFQTASHCQFDWIISQ